MTRPLLVAAAVGSAAAISIGSNLQAPLANAKLSSWLPIGHGGEGSTTTTTTTSKPLVDTEALQALINKSELKARANDLYEIAKKGEDEYGHPTRVIGGEGHEATIRYITDALSKVDDYYNVSTQSFPAVTGYVRESRLVVGKEVPESASPMSLTPPTKNREPVYGDIVLVQNDGCSPEDYPESAKGNIVLVKRGACSFGDKSDQAGKAGAVAAIIYNNEKGAVRGTLGEPTPDHVATFGVSQEFGEKIASQLMEGKKVDAIAYIDGKVETIQTTNVIAQTKGGDQDNCVMLGGHSDSVEEGPGINDDGSGSISVLQVALHLTNFKVNNCVRFAWWAAEEEGLLGSYHYVKTLSDKENEKIRLFMDYDMMASPNYAYQIYNATNAANPDGSEELRDLYVNWYEKQGLNYTFVPFDGRSDYDGFIRGGIPAGGIATGAEGIKTAEEAAMFGGKAGEWYDHCYHQLCDDTNNVDLEAWEVNTKVSCACSFGHLALGSC